MSRELLYENRTDEFYCREAISQNRKLSVRPHLHKHLELVALFEGEVTAVIDSREYFMKAGDVLLTFPHQVHSFRADNTERYLLFILDPELIPEYSDQLLLSLPNSPLIPRLLERKPYIKEIFCALPNVSGRKGREHPFCETTRRGYLLALFGELLSEMSIAPTSGADATVLREIIDYCMRNYTSDLSLSVLETELHISKYYISHLFSERMKVRFNDYINSFRVSAACRYLEQSNKSVTEISRIVGFNTLRTFNRAFAKQVGTTPSAYKKQLEKGTLPDSISL